MTLVLFLICAVAWLLLEFYFVFVRHSASISGRIWEAAREWPPLGMLTGLVVGLLLGHFFFGQCGPY